MKGSSTTKEYYNSKGWKAPTTFAELEQQLADIKADGKVPLAGASKAGWVPLMLANHLWSRYAGPDVTAKFATGEAKWTDPNVVKVLQSTKNGLTKDTSKKANLVSSMLNIQHNSLVVKQSSCMMVLGNLPYLKKDNLAKV